MKYIRRFTILITTILGAVASYLITDLVLQYFGNLSPILLMAIYFALTGLIIVSATFVGVYLAPELKIYSEDLTLKKTSFIIFVVTVALFILGAVFQFIYSLNAQISERHIDNYIVIIDNSDSMNSNDSKSMRFDVVKEIVAQMDDKQTISLLVYGTDVLLAFWGLNINDDEIIRLESTLTPYKETIGSTNSDIALNTALNNISIQNLAFTGNTEIILVSDGYSNYGISTDTLNKSKTANVCINTIGVALSSDWELLNVANQTDGKYYKIYGVSGIIKALDYLLEGRSMRILTAPRQDGSLLVVLLHVSFIFIIGAVIRLSQFFILDRKELIIYLVASLAQVLIAAMLVEILFQTITIIPFISDIPPLLSMNLLFSVLFTPIMKSDGGRKEVSVK